MIETEAAHIGFAPLDPEEEEIADTIAGLYGRASIERIVSGPGLIDIYRHLGGGDWDPHKAGDLWTAAIDGSDALAAHALDILVRCFGAAAGDISLAHGAMGVAISGGLANRIAHLLRTPMFKWRFTAKGRYRERMQRVPVQLATMPSRDCSARRSRSSASNRHPGAGRDLGERAVTSCLRSRPAPG